jgi:hypothetical protein
LARGLVGLLGAAEIGGGNHGTDWVFGGWIVYRWFPDPRQFFIV